MTKRLKHFFLSLFILVLIFSCQKKEDSPPLPDIAVSGSDSLKYSDEFSTSVYTYSISPVEGALYNWNVPDNVQLISGQGTSKITVKINYQFGNGNICVNVTNKKETKKFCRSVRSYMDCFRTSNLNPLTRVPSVRQLPFIFASDNLLFFGGGDDGNIQFKDFYSYDPVLKSLQVLPASGPVETGRSGSACLSVGNSVYLGFGQASGSKFLNDLWTFDSGARKWTLKALNQTVVNYCGNIFQIGNKLYSVTGNQYTNDSALWALDINLNTWHKKTAFPGGARYGSMVFSYNGYGYVIAGGLVDAIYNDVWKYDPINDSWTKLGSFPGSARSYGFGILIGSKLYYGGGRNQNYNPKNDFWEFDLNTETWVKKGDLPYGIVAPGFCSLNGKGYIFGGTLYYNNKSYLNDVLFEFNPN